MAKRKKSIDLTRKDFVRVLTRRKDRSGDSKTLTDLQRRISARTEAINWEKESRERDMISFFDNALSQLDPDSERYRNLMQSKTEYMRSRLDKDVTVKNLSGKVRTTREAKEVLRRLGNLNMSASDNRMKENYVRALRRQGHSNLANRIENMNAEDFVRVYYSNPNLRAGFSYSVNDVEFNYEGRDIFEVQWEETAETVNIGLPGEGFQLPFLGDDYWDDVEVGYDF